MATPQPESPLETMHRLLTAHCVEQALHVVAVAGVADLLRDGPLTETELADATKMNAGALRRLLRMLAAHGVFSEQEDGRFALTPLGTTLRSDVAQSVRDRAILCGLPEMWAAWGRLMHSARTGESAFEDAHGEAFYPFLAREPRLGAPFNRNMTASSRQQAAAIADAYDFSRFRSLVDVGGGHGGTLAAILHAFARLRGVLLDMPSVIAGAKALDGQALEGRSTKVGGDMMEAVPGGHDGYLIKWVMMDRTDDEAVRLLRNCRDAMAEGGRILIVEMLLAERDPPVLPTLFDVQMLMLFGRGRLRSEREFGGLCERAGLRLERCIPTQSPNSILECAAA